MDAASHTGVDDVREIIDASRYAAVSARFKIYIIDEVHMLSKNAFNALLKTLEEPPAHVKFLFATTEVNKVPVTVLSRCQRFDLRRIPADKLGAHFAAVVQAEGVEAEPEALALIARAAEGSARDGLSMLDQAIAHADMEGGSVRADAVRDMLGLSDRGAVRELMALLLGADAPGALALLRRQYALGVDPVAVVRALLETIHAVTLIKVGMPTDAAQSIEERQQLGDWAQALSFAVLHRLWQLLLKGHDEVARAALPIEACEMALLRVIHAATLPDPGDLARQLQSGMPIVVASASPSPSPATAQTEPIAGVVAPPSFDALIDLLDQKRHFGLAEKLRIAVRLVRYEPPAIVLSATKPMPAELPRELADALKTLTGQSWRVTTEDVPGAPSIREAEAARRSQELDAVRAMPVVAAALEIFPDAEITGWNMAERSAS
jgi:DNA polymerase-3 subunit gamma/tau